MGEKVRTYICPVCRGEFECDWLPGTVTGEVACKSCWEKFNWRELPVLVEEGLVRNGGDGRAAGME